MQGVFRIDLKKHSSLRAPYATTPPVLVPPRYQTKPWHMFIESDEAPRLAAQRAVLRAIEFIGQRLGVSPEMAYTLCSVVLDLKISQLVNAPTTTVTAYLPEAIFD